MTSGIPISTSVMHPPSWTSKAYVREQNLHRTVDRAFFTALLLTASVERAEAVILTSSKVMGSDNGPADPLLMATVTAALESQCDASEQTAEHMGRASSMLPLELRHVLRLTADLRRCFVLRVLMGLSREFCARLLRLDAGQIDEQTRNAILELASSQCNRQLTV